MTAAGGESARVDDTRLVATGGVDALGPDLDETRLTVRPAADGGTATADLDDTVLLPERDRPSRAVRRAAPAPAAVAAARVRIGDEVVALDAPLLIGRRPAPPRVALAVPPRLIAVPSPEGGISSTHLRIEQRGASVVVTDLRSTNGTRVEQPGRAPQLLGQGDSLVAAPGARIDLGEGVLIEVLPRDRLG